MIDAQSLANRYIDSWNEVDAATRWHMVETLWADDARYADPLMKAEGHDGIAALIGGIHAQFPGYRFVLNGQADGHGSYVRFSWSLAPADSPSDGHAVARGTDFASVAADGRLAQVTGFLDQMPGAV